MMTPFKSILSRLRKDEEGSAAVETVLVFPMLCWAFLATWVFFDAYRVQSNTVKAAYTISDQLSRETGYITPVYLDSVYNLHEFLTKSDAATKLRVTIVDWSQAENKYRVRWSKGRGGMTELTTATIAEIKDDLPVLLDGEVLVVVQNQLKYNAAFDVGLNDFIFENTIVTRPRFAPKLCYNTVNNGGTSATETC